MRKIIDDKCLYVPGGAAREYASVGCNFYRGCSCQCRYCYNRTGITEHVLGIDHPVLKDCFTNTAKRPKKYRHLSGEDYAFEEFKREVDKYYDFLRDVGIFFSFTTDPMLPSTRALTICATMYALEHGVPVMVLTKCASLTPGDKTIFKFLPYEQRKLFAIGFTLTGRDDWEPYASPNTERINTMRWFHEQGYNTFASIEPIVDFQSSLAMVKEAASCCDLFLIGLMSCRAANGLPPYERKECAKFCHDVIHFIRLNNFFCKVYWKESIQKLVNSERILLATKRDMFSKDISVGRCYSLYYGCKVYPIHQLVKDCERVVDSLSAFGKEKDMKNLVCHYKSIERLYYSYDIEGVYNFVMGLFSKDKHHVFNLCGLLHNLSERLVYTFEEHRHAFECFLSCYQDEKKLDYQILLDEINTLASQSKMLLELLTKKMEEKT